MRGALFFGLFLLAELFSSATPSVRITSFRTGLGRGQRGVCNEPPCADCGQETDCTYLRHDLSRSYAKND